MDVHFYPDAAEFRDEARSFLAQDPLSFNVIATNADKISRLGTPADAPCWFATVSDTKGIRGVAMRTHPDPPHPGFVAHMPPEAAQTLGEALAARQERVPAWNGDLNAARALCALAADGRPVDIAMHTRLFEARHVVWPKQPAGALRPATPADDDLAVAWTGAFHRDADEQAGRPTDTNRKTSGQPLSMLPSYDLWIWELDGQPVHLTGVRQPALGASRIGPVYTPPEHRGRGYAGWTVACLTQQILDAGNRPCLYTDQANPISNKIYERIGFQRVHDEANFTVSTE